tara:strand:+ start:1098 stop:1553 length:456 start_codon:yes stop_codon:yes gene_type:complete
MKLNIGCGNDYMEGWTNLDCGDCRCDISHDIEVTPWPIESNSIKEVLMKHVLEHVSRENFINVIRELYRVCSAGAKIHIQVPYAGSDNFWTDPTHKMPITTRTLDYFDRNKQLGENGKIYGWHDVDFSVVSQLVDNPPNGPDVFFYISVNK